MKAKNYWFLVVSAVNPSREIQTPTGPEIVRVMAP